MQPYDTKKFELGLQELGISLTEKQVLQFMKYYEILVEWNKVMNLTAITEFDDVIEKHFIDSLSIVRALDMNGIHTLIDVGTGAGFPGIPLAIAFPHVRVTLLDSLMKRVKFLNEVVSQLGLENVEAFQGRAEDFGRDKRYRGKYDLVVSRAVANLSPLMEYCIPFAARGGAFMAYKSGKADEEIKTSANARKILGCEVEKTESFTIGSEDMNRVLVLLRKQKDTPNKYPRKAGTPTKEPL